MLWGDDLSKLLVIYCIFSHIPNTALQPIHLCPSWTGICKLSKNCSSHFLLHSLLALLLKWTWPPRERKKRLLISLNNSHAFVDLIPMPNSAPLMVSLSLMGYYVKAWFAFHFQHLPFFFPFPSLNLFSPTRHSTHNQPPADHNRSSFILCFLAWSLFDWTSQ